MLQILQWIFRGVSAMINLLQNPHLVLIFPHSIFCGPDASERTLTVLKMLRERGNG